MHLMIFDGDFVLYAPNKCNFTRWYKIQMKILKDVVHSYQTLKLG